MLLLKAPEEDPFSSLPSFLWLLVILGAPGCVEASFQSLSLLSCGISLHVSVSLCVNFSLPVMALILAFRPSIIQYVVISIYV